MPELHAIYAYLETDTKVRVSGDLDWQTACERYHDPERPLYAGGIADREPVYVGDFIGAVRWFAVRAVADPNWPAGQPPHDIETESERDWREVCEFLIGSGLESPPRW